MYCSRFTFGQTCSGHNTWYHTQGNSIGNYMKRMTLNKWHFELNIKRNNLINGFPGLLNTLGTLLDRSQTILQFFKTCKQLGIWCMYAETFGAKSMPVGCMSMERLGIPKALAFLSLEKVQEGPRVTQTPLKTNYVL